jgi:predicted TIM-barrel fold metal-dependent hydrolase
MRHLSLVFATASCLCTLPLQAAELPIFDAHVHYSHDAAAQMPVKEAAAILRKAGLKRALVSSSGDEGTQALLAEAPDIVVPSLRPYRTRGELSTWTRDDSVVGFLEDRLRRHRYAAIGEFHLFGADAELPVPKRLVALAKQHKLVLHAHSDADAIGRLFQQDPQARILWAHSGFDRPEQIAAMLRKHKNLWCDLAFRSEHGGSGKVPAEWRALFNEFPDRFTVGTDTFTPERWHYIVEHANWSRAWLADLPPALAERIAWRNAEALFEGWKAPSAQ